MNKDTPILIDFDGVLRLGSKPAPDAVEFLNFLNAERLPFFIITNSTRETAGDIKNFLFTNGIGFPVNAMSTVDTTITYLEEKNLKAAVYCIDSTKRKFEKYIDNENPQAVVIGDLGTGWTYDILNEIFNIVHNGAEIIAMQKNKFWMPDEAGLVLDAGAFIAAIEYASGKSSTLIGKPSPVYFRTALKMLGFNNDASFLMLGDDIGNDIHAAKQNGGKGILILTGKTKLPLPAEPAVQPDYIAQNLKEAIDVIKSIL